MTNYAKKTAIVIEKWSKIDSKIKELEKKRDKLDKELDQIQFEWRLNENKK